VCQERRIAVVVHCGMSNFAGASNRLADPALPAGVIRDFPSCGWSSPMAAEAGRTARTPGSPH